MRFNRVEITLSDRKRRYKNSIRRKLKGVKRKIALRSGGIVGWAFTNTVDKNDIRNDWNEKNLNDWNEKKK